MIKASQRIEQVQSATSYAFTSYSQYGLVGLGDLTDLYVDIPPSCLAIQLLLPNFPQPRRADSVTLKNPSQPNPGPRPDGPPSNKWEPLYLKQCLNTNDLSSRNMLDIRLLWKLSW